MAGHRVTRTKRSDSYDRREIHNEIEQLTTTRWLVTSAPLFYARMATCLTTDGPVSCVVGDVDKVLRSLLRIRFLYKDTILLKMANRIHLCESEG
eukprot:scaffold3515_cov126-Cylindrotheca_fusiformis.AAC.41